ncbi:MAG TPA: 7-cyano-7-deazaguanine synthase [Clostridia bacterium]|nr:7-cyano-7-deazaguanine synthase [Clostridia bacterium]
MDTCIKCLLNDNMPSVRINSDGLCNYCTDSIAHCTDCNSFDEEFVNLLEMYRDRRYQVIMAFSGGKDSTYTLKMIREKYNASILAVTFNNGFLSEASLRNISKVTDQLGVDGMILKYPAAKLIKAFRFIEDGRAFPKMALERASSICNLCIMLIKNMIYYEAIIRDIPIICFGWTPGQAGIAKPLLKLDYRTVTKVFENVRNAIVNELGMEYGKYFLDSGFMSSNQDRIPYLYYPFVKNHYNEAAIFDDIKKIGWESPENTDGNSSNCLLNSYANQSHMERFGYHPYAYEISNMVRDGYMTRAEGAEKMENIKNDNTYEIVRNMFRSI